MHSEWYSHRFLLLYEHAGSNGLSLGCPKFCVYGTFEWSSIFGMHGRALICIKSQTDSRITRNGAVVKSS